MNARTRQRERRATGISILVALQALACAFFLADLVGDIAADGIGPHLVIEAMAAVALLVAVVLGALQVRSLIAAARRDEAAVAAAKGALADLIGLRFAEWQLTAGRGGCRAVRAQGLRHCRDRCSARVGSRHGAGPARQSLCQGRGGFAVGPDRAIPRRTCRPAGRETIGGPLTPPAAPRKAAPRQRVMAAVSYRWPGA